MLLSLLFIFNGGVLCRLFLCKFRQCCLYLLQHSCLCSRSVCVPNQTYLHQKKSDCYPSFSLPSWKNIGRTLVYVCALNILSNDVLYTLWQRDARKLKGDAYLVTNNPYDMEDILMPLHEYINNPIAQDIIHNGATFQVFQCVSNSLSWQYFWCGEGVLWTLNAYSWMIYFLNSQIAGLTNNSYFVDAHDIRHCVFKHKSLGEYVLKVAKVLLKIRLSP